MMAIKLYGIVAAAFMAGAFVASPELRAYAANTVFSSDIVDGQVMTVDLANNAVTSTKINDGGVKTADIGDGEVKAADIGFGAVNSAKIADNSITAADIGANAVGASELQGVTKLQFTACSITDYAIIVPGGSSPTLCSLPGLTTSDRVIVTKEHGNQCLVVTNAVPSDTLGGTVIIYLGNECATNQQPGIITFSVIAYRPG